MYPKAQILDYNFTYLFYNIQVIATTLVFRSLNEPTTRNPRVYTDFWWWVRVRIRIEFHLILHHATPLSDQESRQPRRNWDIKYWEKCLIGRKVGIKEGTGEEASFDVVVPTRGKELTPKIRNKVCALAEDGHRVLYIMARYKLSRKAVRYTLDHEASRPETNESIRRPGAKKTYSHLDERNILWHAREYPQNTYAQLIKVTGVTCSPKVVRHIL
ncbi:hypothetical protein G7Y89_g3818 [Cudoniella acicularis]|uniref:Uncharacterized protein n=1 Tax=Cudoniella acicularis TaxID=354080 RepID=A0A8H4RRG1_9HELO|nr:hypothetical protein G7Y89_g3818 [Cudoniella acicularis]